MCVEYDLVFIKDFSNTLQNQNILLSHVNFSLVDLSIDFILKLDKNISFINNKEMSVSSKPHDLQGLLLIATKSFVKSRFYNDDLIPNSMASKLYENWLINAAKDKNRFFISDNQSRCFLIFSKTNDNKGVIIELIAVDENYKKQGFGKSLIETLIEYSINNDYEYISVLTQFNNFEAIKLYSKFGFSYKNLIPIYHYWRIGR